MLKDVRITSIIIQRYLKEFETYLKADVAIIGAGPAGLTAAYFLAQRGHKIAVFEKKLSIGGGMWGGGIMFNLIVFQEEAREIFAEFEIPHQSHGDGYYSADAVLAVTSMGAKAIRSGAKIFNLLAAEDVLTEGGERVTGVVLNWTAVQMANLHVDPVAVEAAYVIDTTGHDCQVVRFVQEKLKGKLFTETGKIIGERPMWAAAGENFLLDHTREVFPGLYVAGMSAGAVFGGHRMGPVFGGMVLSGRKAAREIDLALKKRGS